MKPLFGGIEAGGTKFVCMVGDSPDHIVAQTLFPTSQPTETLHRAADFFRPFALRGELQAVGIGSFGPVDLEPTSPTYGFITTTPKSGWQMTDISGIIRNALDIPVVLDTDVNAAALGEHYWIPENRALDPFLYVTIGTGIGVGAIVNQKPLHGLIHPESGHMLIPHDLQKDPFPGVCPFHSDCWEGLASGPSMAKRWSQSAETLPNHHPAWELEHNYIASAIANLIMTYSPRRIVLGGGVTMHPGLHASVREATKRVLNRYIHSPLIEEEMDSFLVPPGLGNASGVFGAIAMAHLA